MSKTNRTPLSVQGVLTDNQPPTTHSGWPHARRANSLDLETNLTSADMFFRLTPAWTEVAKMEMAELPGSPQVSIVRGFFWIGCRFEHMRHRSSVIYIIAVLRPDQSLSPAASNS